MAASLSRYQVPTGSLRAQRREQIGGGINPRAKDVPIYTAGSRNVPPSAAADRHGQSAKK